MKTAWIFVFISIVLSACHRDPTERLIGHWRSDEPRTLAEFDRAKAAGRLTDWAAGREAIYRDGFFGRLEILVEANRSKAWFPEDRPEDIPWGAHIIRDLGDDRFQWGPKEAKPGQPNHRIVQLQRDGQCYRTELPEMGFTEWFCRLASQ